MGKDSALIFICLTIISACASTAGGPYNRAVENYSAGRIGDSIDAYRQAIIIDPSDLQAKFNLAVIYQDQGKSEEAESLYRTILNRNPGFAPAWSNLASVEEKHGLLTEAENHHRRAVLADRDGCAASSQFGYFLLRAQRSDEAAQVFEQSTKADPPCANAWFGLAEIARAKGDYPAALKSYDKALIYNPSDLEARRRSADILISLGDRGRAAELLLKAASLNPDRGDINLQLGILLREQGRLKDAEKALEAAKKAGAPQAECDRELSILYGKLSEEAAGKAR
ncbi:MAG TPA: tetratricopeptide repeat protein [Syntrophobacteraceae bacterium]|nr:tetratricopeptide repeat protein [Syntrophobacteraceae bacterium]